MNSIDTQRKQVIRKILEMESLHQTLTEESVSQLHKDLFEEACSLFGTWEIALDYAGVRLRPVCNKALAPGAVVGKIRSHVAKLYSVKAMNVRRSDSKLYKAAIATFGSWRNALKEAGVDTTRLYYGPTSPKLSDEQIFQLLRDRFQQGKPMRFIDFACDNMAAARLLELRFKSWKKALRLAGLTDSIDSIQEQV
ncbi:hypothetical protein VN12_24250 [Pirellula sp. SH-Sr6A]|uniref:hypothetical protein n=1 Tax=Pirellula sp. SH-Sr6A TaxID=1632865 RepID=UPI00078D1F72|nr:hypothetical protein [Pirellula sp. SH-Sr6A]AMV35259.1 hypothetical protein VN12_24250 [Pirellula sp. SH-Sr6A]